jgi:hypothetical protein
MSTQFLKHRCDSWTEHDLHWKMLHHREIQPGILARKALVDTICWDAPKNRIWSIKFGNWYILVIFGYVEGFCRAYYQAWRDCLKKNSVRIVIGHDWKFMCVIRLEIRVYILAGILHFERTIYRGSIVTPLAQMYRLQNIFYLLLVVVSLDCKTMCMWGFMSIMTEKSKISLEKGNWYQILTMIRYLNIDPSQPPRCDIYFYLSIDLSICLSIYLFIYLSILSPVFWLWGI